MRGLTAQQLFDILSETVLIVGRLEGEECKTKTLEFFEHAIVKNANGVRDALYQRIWVGLDGKEPLMLTTHCAKGVAPGAPEIRLWDHVLISLDQV